MIRIFGTRWIPFEEALSDTTEPARGFGIHGAPWYKDEESDQLIENRSCLGKYESDGCIRLGTEDMEELFSIIVTKPTTIEIVTDISQAHLPGQMSNIR